MSHARFLRVWLVAAVIVLLQATRILGGTTGSISGYALQPDGSPVAGATVSATSPSQSSSTTTDANGHFAFVSLIPDTYTVSVSKDGYDTVSQPGVTVLADASQIVRLHTEPMAKVIGHITSRANGLVKAGTTSDVYSVNAATQSKVATLGGSGALDQAYGAIASQPGVVVPPGQMGWMQTINIRGGDFDQVGYEFDGVPTLRSYDDYASTSLSSLGQQELQVYTGGAPANSESQGLAGYVNQVIKSGTYPGFANLTLGIGAPTMYNKLDFEAGGATANRSFSYYVAFGNSSQDFRDFDQFNGASLQNDWGAPFATLPCPVARGTSQSGGGNPNLASCYAAGDIGPGGYVLGPPIDDGQAAQVWDHESITNFHFAIPHHNDGGKDDVQLLFDNTYLHTTDYSSAADWNVPGNQFLTQLNGGPAFGYLSGPVFGWQYLGQVGRSLPSTLTLGQLQSMVNPVFFAYNPDSQKNLTGVGGEFAPIPTDLRDGTANPNSIIKLQYQRNISSDSYIRVYGFQNWSGWPQTCPNTGYTNFVGYCPLNYYVSTYTSGVSTQYANQINDKNLINLEVSDFWANDYRANDDTMINQLEGLNANTGLDSFLYLVNAKHPNNGVCYTSAGQAVSCYSGNAATVGLCQAGTGGNGVGIIGGNCIGDGAGAMPSVPGSCGGSACAWFVAENGQTGGGNSAKPNFGWASIQDQWKPSQSLLFNVGARYTRYAYDLSNTGGAARDFWFNSFNNSYCVLPGAGQKPFYNPADDGGSNQPCPLQNGIQTVPATMTNQPNAVTTFTDVEPRVGGTYTAGENDVFRFSYGRYNQPPNTAYEQYNLLQQDLASYDALHFWPIGFTTTTHVIRPPTSNNYDVSWEHRFTNDMSFKLTPYLRTTRDQIENFFLDPKTGFVSGLNAGEQTSAGLEFELNQGDFNRNGFASLLSFTFNHSLIKYTPLQNGGSVLSSVNLYIQQYNSFTKACAGVAPSTNPNAPCGTYGGSNAVATEPSGVANPYFDAPEQSLVDLNGSYQPYQDVPNAIGLSDFGYEVPVSAAFVLNFKHDKWAVAPEFQYFGGGWYGDPLQNYGVDPSSCGALNNSGSVSGDPRYPYGGSGNPYDALTCGSTIAMPDPYTGKFDSIGAFREPNHFLMHMQMSYAVSPRASLVANFSNIINRCSGGSVEPWTRFASSQVCQYTTTGYVTAPTEKYGANFYNPGSTFQPETQYPYQENPFVLPFEATFELQIKM